MDIRQTARDHLCHLTRSRAPSHRDVQGPWTDTPLTFDSRYFQLLLECEWEETKANGMPARRCAQYPDLLMLPTDHALASDAAFKGHTARFASSLPTFHAEFAAAFQRLQENGHPDLVEVG